MADKKRKDNSKFDEFLSLAKELIKEKVLPFGLRLIHRHGVVSSDEKMVEEFIIDNGDPAFVSTPQPLNFKAFPASWMIDGGSLKVFEYSTDARVQQNIDMVF